MQKVIYLLLKIFCLLFTAITTIKALLITDGVIKQTVEVPGCGYDPID